MSLTMLPVEVLETLFLHVGAEDLLKVWDVVKLEGSNAFWKTVCRRQGYRSVPGEKESWRSVFERNINWTNQTFEKREYQFKKQKRSVQSRSDPKDVLNGKHFLVKDAGDDVLVWNIDGIPELVQNLPAGTFRTSGSKLSTHSPTGTTIYFKKNNHYNKLIDLEMDLSDNFSVYHCLSDKFFAAFEKNLMTIRIVNLVDLENFSFTVSSKKMMPLSLFLTGDILDVMLVEANQFLLKRFNLERKEPLDDLVLFRGAALISVPYLKFSADLIAGWCNVLEGRGITLLKVWSSKGNLLESLSFDFLIPSSQLGCPEQILWMLVEGEYVILSTTRSSISIWTSKSPNVCVKMSKEENFYNGQCIVSSSLLVLSYSYCFKVVDFKDGSYLYDVQFENCPLNHDKPWVPQPFLANEYFYMMLQECEVKTGGSSTEDKLEVNSTSLGDITGSNETLKPKVAFTEYNLCIYDFRS